MSYLTPLFCKLNDGREMVVFSDNEAQETRHVFPVADLDGYDAEFQCFEEVPYSAVHRTDRNRVSAFI